MKKPKSLFQLSNDELLRELRDYDRDTLVYRVLPHFLLEIMHKYFRVEVEGAENLPKTGRALLTPNHSGFSGFDAMVLSHEITRACGRYPKVLTHHLWFLTKTTSVPAQRLGFVEATMANGLQNLQKNNMVVLFPEGEAGNFKPSRKAYRLQEFKRGFVRMALKTGAPIIPTLVLGAEETHINLSQLKLTKYLRGVVLPLPLNLLPLPARWKIIFMPPILLPYHAEAANDSELVHELAADIRERMQKRLNRELASRPSLYTLGLAPGRSTGNE